MRYDYVKNLLGRLTKKQSTICPFLKFDFPWGNIAQAFEFAKDLILKDSCPGSSLT